MKYILLLTTFFLGGCVSYMQVEPADTTDVTYDNGLPVVKSRGEFSTIQVMPAQHEYEKGKVVGLWVNVSNHGPIAFTVDASDVTATDIKGDMRVWTYDERMKKIRRDAAWAAVAQGFAAGANSAAASMKTQTAYTSGSAYGGGSTVNYNSSTTYQDTAAVAKADAENRRNMEQLASRVRSEKDAAELILKTTTVQPGDSLTGYIMMNAPGGKPGIINMAMNVGEDTHEVPLNYVKKQ